VLDKNKVYVIVFKEDETGHISGDDPRVPPYLAANAFIEEFRGKMCLSYLSVGDEREHLLEGEIIEDPNNGIVFHAKYEQRANNKRIERGESPKKYHDATDCPPPVNVIDWTKH